MYLATVGLKDRFGSRGVGLATGIRSRVAKVRDTDNGRASPNQVTLKLQPKLDLDEKQNARMAKKRVNLHRLALIQSHYNTYELEPPSKAI
ncbi:hypothetical protein JTE90_028252 [Oedothorax gibbosus]|uniref:Uncharacterized protein n=1 Tax=Oedothorax gibbosus TaxID=931172 RepID=A0AAV6UTT1_9ARAC|nr:hypothetical protein JTE90_028252 [Oedothorax gibbosus]